MRRVASGKAQAEPAVADNRGISVILEHALLGAGRHVDAINIEVAFVARVVRQQHFVGEMAAHLMAKRTHAPLGRQWHNGAALDVDG